jgi:hypothetical protein
MERRRRRSSAAEPWDTGQSTFGPSYARSLIAVDTLSPLPTRPEPLDCKELVLDGQIDQGAPARIDRLDYRPHPSVERVVIR